MTLPAQRSPRPSAYGIAPLLLLVAVLVAVAVLFAQSWNGFDEERAFAERERQGVEYLRTLNQVTMALVDTQTAMVAGRAPSRDALNQAVEGTTSVDARLGGDLRTRERWAGVRAKIEALPERGLSTPREIDDAFGETTSLLLALYDKVRESSGLIRTPNADAYHLQDSAADKLPDALVAAGRLTSLASLATTRGPDDQIRTITEFSAARSGLQAPVEELVRGLQSAVDNTESQQLSGNLLRHLDAYQQGMEALARASTTGGAKGPDPARVEAARKEAQRAAADLSEVMLAELDALIETRLRAITGQRRLAGAAAAAGLLFGLGLAYLLLAPGRRRAPEPPEQTDQGQSGTHQDRAGYDRSEYDGPGHDPDDGSRPWRQNTSWADPAGAFAFEPATAGTPQQAPVAATGARLGAGAGAGAGTTHGDRPDRPTRWGRTDADR